MIFFWAFDTLFSHFSIQRRDQVQNGSTHRQRPHPIRLCRHRKLARNQQQMRPRPRTKRRCRQTLQQTAKRATALFSSTPPPFT